MGRTHPPGPALVTAAADADPVTLLVLGWLAAKPAENTRTAYASPAGRSATSRTPWATPTHAPPSGMTRPGTPRSSTWHGRSTGSLVADGPARECWLTRRAAFSPGWAAPQVVPSTRWTAPQSTPSAAWCLWIASSSGPSSR